MMECQKIKNLKNCPCTYPNCSRKGLCCQCLHHHLENHQLPACCFPPDIEKTYDRSFEAFVESVQKGKI